MIRLERTLQRASDALFLLGGVAIVLMMLHVCLDVFGKYMFGKPLTGTLEIVSWYYMVACAFLPMAYVQLRKEHLTVEVFTMYLSERKLSIIDGFASIIGAIYTSILTYLVFLEAVATTRDREILNLTFMDIPAWPARWILPASFGLLCAVFLFQAAADLWFGFTGRGRATAVDQRGSGDMGE